MQSAYLITLNLPFPFFLFYRAKLFRGKKMNCDYDIKVEQVSL